MHSLEERLERVLEVAVYVAGEELPRPEYVNDVLHIPANVAQVEPTQSLERRIERWAADNARDGREVVIRATRLESGDVRYDARPLRAYDI